MIARARLVELPCNYKELPDRLIRHIAVPPAQTLMVIDRSSAATPRQSGARSMNDNYFKEAVRGYCFAVECYQP